MAKTFMEVSGDEIIAHQWEEINGSLIAAWNRGQFGKRGGRPRKTLTKPSRLSLKTSKGALTEPWNNPIDKIDKIEKMDGSGLEKNGSEGNPPASPVAPAEPSRFVRIRDSYIAAWENRFKTKYVFATSRDGKAVKELAGTKLTVEEIVTRARQGWDNSNNFIAERSATIFGFQEVMNQIVASNGHLSPGAKMRKERDRGLFPDNSNPIVKVYTDAPEPI